MSHRGPAMISSNPGRPVSARVFYRTTIFCVLFACLAVRGPIAHAQSGTSSATSSASPASLEEARAAITRGYDRLDQAIGAKDAVAYAAMFAPEATITGGGFEFPILDFAAMLSNMLLPLLEASQSTAIESLVVDGEKATTTARSRFRMMQKSPDGKPSIVEVFGTSRDVWQVTGGEWRIVSSVEISLRTWIDGVETGTVTPLSATERKAIAVDLRTVARPFATVDAGNGFDDLAILDELIGDARVVGLGESSHGGSEQFRMKHRIIEYLVKRKGFAVIAFEGNWLATDLVDDYVKGGQSSVAAGIERLGYWVWRTEEVKGLIEWMRTENLARHGKTRLSFTGFDMQYLEFPTACVLDHFAKLGGPDLSRLRKLYRKGEDAVESSGPPKSAKELEVLLADIRGRVRDALGIVDGRRAELVASSSESEFQRARQCARVIVQNAENLLAGLSHSVRDQAMADNVRWLADIAHPGEKIVLWAHNGHIGSQPGMMGGHLRQAFGKDMVSLGFASHHGEILANPIKDGKVDGELYSVVGPVPIALASPAAGSIDDVLSTADLPHFIVNLSKVPATSALGQWLAKPQAETFIGWPYDPTKPNGRPIVLPNTYDGIVFIARSSASVLLK